VEKLADKLVADPSITWSTTINNHQVFLSRHDCNPRFGKGYLMLEMMYESRVSSVLHYDKGILPIIANIFLAH
jgi:hypothetical protein